MPKRQVRKTARCRNRTNINDLKDFKDFKDFKVINYNG